jgi:acylphosphatase
MEQVRMRILIEGRLQAVNFRLRTRQEAKNLGLTGFVRTLSDGRIEIEAQGSEDKVTQLLTWCQQDPQSNQIKSIFYRYDEANERYTDFDVR